MTKAPHAFQFTPLATVGVFHRLLGRVPRECAFAELRNVLASRPYTEVSRREVSDILGKAKLTVEKARSELCGIYEHAALCLVSDGVLDQEDQRSLAALESAFGLSGEDASEVRQRVAAAMYLGAMRESLADGVFTTEERDHLAAIASSLSLPSARVKEIFEKTAVAAVQDQFNAAIADRRYTDNEEQAVLALAASLGVSVTYDEKTAAIVERVRELGRIADGRLPEVSVSLMLQRGEVCHFAATNVAHREMRVVTKRVQYSGPTASIKIVKGVRWRVGSISVARVTRDVHTHVVSGHIFNTSKRAVFKGARTDTSIPL